MNRMLRYFLFFSILSILFFISFHLYKKNVLRIAQNCPKLNLIQFKTTSSFKKIVEINEDPENFIDFEGFNNEKGANKSIIPNIFHLIYFETSKLEFYQLVNILAIYYNHKPELIHIYCDKCNFTGRYFDILKSYKDLWDRIKFFKVKYKNTIFGVEYGWVHHRSDVWRLLVLMNYGGVYVDNDVFVVKSLQQYFKYEMVLSWNEPQETEGVGNQVFIAHRNARLLKAHYDNYRYNYTPGEWYYNGGFAPAEILRKNKNIVKAIPWNLGTHMLVPELYHIKNWKGWTKYDTIHLLMNHRSYLDEKSPIKEFNETNIWNYKYAYGEMVRSVLYKANLFLPKNKILTAKKINKIG